MKDYRPALVDFIRRNAKPPDKFSHQARLYALAKQLARGRACDDDVVFAAVWLHDLGVFIGRRPETPAALAAWDHVAYACREAPKVLRRLGFPPEKIPAVLEVIRSHLPSARPVSLEGWLVRDADILEQLGAVGILRTVSKVGRDTRFIRFSDALACLRRQADQLPARLHFPAARRLARRRVRVLKAFLAAAEAEAAGLEW
ncbi:MAG TPA: HD domain-containing protein [Dongiaceae bacterium]|nr:HD domain-containing protein [Dongiaceae bacterium]